MALEFTTSYLNDVLDLCRHHKRLAERALEQVPDEMLNAAPGAESNSIAIIVKHLAGNMRSRWTDFLTTDGEKPNRHRDTEFEKPPQSRAELIELWESGWDCLLSTLSSLTDRDLGRKVTIRGEAHSVMQAINRQVGHTSYHLGQIVYLAKHYAGSRWQTLSVPRGKSEEYLKKVASGEISQR